MTGRTVEISATGTRGKIKGKKLTAVKRGGGYVLHSKIRARSTGKPLRFSINKIIVGTLDEAAELLNTKEYAIRLFNDAHKQWNLRERDGVTIVSE